MVCSARVYSILHSNERICRNIIIEHYIAMERRSQATGNALGLLQASVRVKPQKAIKPKEAESKQKKQPFIDEEKIAGALAKFNVLTTTDNKKRRTRHLWILTCT